LRTINMGRADKIIICKGTANIPPRFWSWIVCCEDEFTEDIKKQGFIKTECAKYLTLEQLKYLNE